MGRHGVLRKAVVLLQLSPPPLAADGCLTKGRNGGRWSRVVSSSSPQDPPLTSATPTTKVFFSTSSSRLPSFPPSAPSTLRSPALFSTAIQSPTPSSPRGGRGGADDEEAEEFNIEWEEEEEVEPVIGDGGDGGGVVLGEVAWGERTLSVAREVLLQFGDDMAMYAFKVSPRGYIYVRLDKVTNKYGCPSIEEMENFSKLYKQQLDEIGERGEIPVDLGLEVSSPGAERLLKVPEDLDRFRQLPMWVKYLEEGDDISKHHQQSEKVFMLDLVDSETGHCVWKLADVKENKVNLKGRPLSRKKKDWRLRLPFTSLKRVMLYLDSKD